MNRFSQVWIERRMEQSPTLKQRYHALLDARIFSARCLEVYASGEVKRCPPGAAVTGCPHAKQKPAPVGSSLLHLAQASVRPAPHFIQKCASAGFSCWYRGHVMPSPSRA